MNFSRSEHIRQADNFVNYLLAQIHIVLVETTLPANIGSAARAMKTMGLQHLHVVNPKHALDDDALAHAAGAKEILEHIHYHDTLEQAITNAHSVWAASSRKRSLPQPLLSVREACEHFATLYDKKSNSLSSFESFTDIPEHLLYIVFGREDRGLTNEELALAQLHVTIPANPDYGVLNLAAAVQVMGYEMRQTLLTHIQTAHTELEPVLNTDSKTTRDKLHMTLRTDWDEPPVTQAQMQHLEANLIQLAESIELYDSENPRNTPKRIKRLLSRTQLDRMEYNLLQATLKKVRIKLESS